MAVARVLAEAHVGDDEEVGNRVLHGADRLLDDAVLGVRLAAAGVLFCGQAEEEHGGDAHGRRVLALLQQLIHREAALPRHGADGLAHSAAMGHEERVDEIIHLEVGLADHLAQERQLAETTGSVQGRRHG